mgnify:FL=1|jgi:3-oxoacyl-[acyl-carrier protein] reductase
MNILQGKNAFISGATGGIGKSVAHALVDSGCNLFLTSTNDKSLQEVIDSLSNKNVVVAGLSGDLNKIKDVYAIIKAAKAKFNSIDVLVNSAGIFPNFNLFDSDDDRFEETFNINFRSAFMFTREFAKGMVKNEWGRVVNIGSSSAYAGFGGTSMYCSSKHALLGFSRAIHDELKGSNVRTFCVSPSSTQSKMGKATIGQDYSTFLKPDDIAKYVIFVISFNSNIMSEEIFLKRMIVQ